MIHGAENKILFALLI